MADADAAQSAAVMHESIRVVTLTATPVKGLRICEHSSVMIEQGGVRNDRPFYLVDDRGRMVNGKHLGSLSQVSAELGDDDRLTLTFPKGAPVSGRIGQGGVVETRFFSGTRLARLVPGPFSAALSTHAGQPLRLVRAADGSSAIDRGQRGAITLVSRAPLSHLARVAGEAAIDARRFRMSIEIDGVRAFAEDQWLGRELAVGGATIVLHGHVGRCIVTSRNPDSGDLDVPTLDLLRSFRSDAATSEPLALGVYGSVLRPGIVHVGDAVEITRACVGARDGRFETQIE